jgi:signal transduction histidine kinase
VATLEQSRIFAQLRPEELKRLSGIAQERSFAAGQEIFKEGSPGDGLYVLKKGLVEICATLGGARHAISEVKPGEVFGEMAVLENEGRSASAVAKQASDVYFLARQEVLSLVERSPAVALALLREISHRLREFNSQYLREVIQAERLAVIGRFARSIVHDLKNPLNVIGLTSEIAGMKQATDQERQEAAKTIQTQVDRINEMVSEILNYTMGTPTTLVLPPTNYARFIETVTAELQTEAALKNVSVELASPPPDVSLVINPKRLRRVFHNLAQNATEAIENGGKILLRFEVRPDEVVTEIEDTGPGIAPEIADHLFQAFATHGKLNGTGLGLSICKRIIEDHHGWIEARHSRGHGAVFAFGLPRPPRDETGLASPAPVDAAEPRKGARRRKFEGSAK